MRQCIGNNIDYSGNCVAPIETEADIEACAKEKIEIVNDFFYAKNQLNEEEKDELYKHLSSLESIRAIDTYFRNFINARM